MKLIGLEISHVKFWQGVETREKEWKNETCNRVIVKVNNSLYSCSTGEKIRRIQRFLMIMLVRNMLEKYICLSEFKIHRFCVSFFTYCACGAVSAESLQQDIWHTWVPFA